MPVDNAHLIREVLDAVSRGDFDVAFRHAAPDFEADFSRAHGLVRGIRKRDEFRSITEDFNRGWESVRFEADEFIEAGEEVVTPFTTHLRGRDGIEVQDRGVWVWTLRDGVIARLCLYQERAEALAAVGLRQ